MKKSLEPQISQNLRPVKLCKKTLSYSTEFKTECFRIGFITNTRTYNHFGCDPGIMVMTPLCADYSML